MANLSSPPHPSPPSSLPSHPDTISHPTSPTPALTPSPAATSSPSHPASRPFQDTAVGRNKSQRWSRDTPPSGKSGGGISPLSFKDALLSTFPPAPSASALAPSESLPRPAPRILLRVANSRSSLAKRSPDAEGWQEAESKCSRKAHQMVERGSRRLVPTDLRGLCFNCFSPEHRAAVCTNRTRCFRCRRLGHRASRCPNSGMSTHPELPVQPPTANGSRILVWRRKEVSPATARGSDGSGGTANLFPPADGAGADGPPPTDAVPSGGVVPVGGGRCRQRRWNAAPAEDNSQPPAVANRTDVMVAMADCVAPRPRRIIDRSEIIASVEEELRYALSILVVGDPMALSVDGLVAELTHRYDLPAGSLALHLLSPNELLLVFSNEADAVRVYDNERPIQLPQVMVHCRRWTRLKNASSFTLPNLVDIEVRGVPPHVWELETAEHLLDKWCWVHALHSNTLEHKDYSSFRVSA
ncbi:unnamed protein product [Urochloa humidicola]